MSARLDLQRVLVTDLDESGHWATVQSSGGALMKVSTLIRNGKGAWPRIGEVWLISKQYGDWCFAALMDQGRPPVISVRREGADALALKLLDTLVALGLVEEEGSGTDYTGNDFSTTGFTPDSTMTLSGEGDGPPATTDESEVIPVPLWLGSFNTDGSIRPNAAVQRDLAQVVASPVQILALQEMDNLGQQPGYRDPLAQYLQTQGWTVLRQEGDNSQEWNWLCFKTDQFDLVDSGLEMLTDRVSEDSGIARWAYWARLKHLASGQRIVAIATHLVPPGRFAAHYYTDQVAAVAALVDEHASWGAVYLLGDMNVDYRNSATYTSTGYPGTVWTAHGLVPVWQFSAPSDIGTHGLPLIDYVYQGPDYARIGTFQEQQILRGCLSSHRPVLTRMRIKRKDTDIT